MSIAFQALYIVIAITALVISSRRNNRPAKTLSIIAVVIAGVQVLMWALYLFVPFGAVAATKAILSPAPDAVLGEGALIAAYDMAGGLGWLFDVLEWALFLGVWGVAIAGLVLALRTPQTVESVNEPSPAYATVGGPTTAAAFGAPAAPATNTLNGLALASIIVVWFSSVIGLVLGHVALSQIKRTGQEGRGLALTAVIVGWVFTGLVIITAVVAFAVIGTYGGWTS